MTAEYEALKDAVEACRDAREVFADALDYIRRSGDTSLHDALAAAQEVHMQHMVEVLKAAARQLISH